MRSSSLPAPIVRSAKLGLLSVLVMTCLSMLLPSASLAESRRASFHPCGSIPSLTSWSIKAKRVSCRRARRVVRAYVSAYIENPDGTTKDVRGFHCRLSGYYGDGAYYRCSAGGHRVVRFARGG
jgi:hypothetical protein